MLVSEYSYYLLYSKPQFITSIVSIKFVYGGDNINGGESNETKGQKKR